jgi:hypothetical protein
MDAEPELLLDFMWTGIGRKGWDWVPMKQPDNFLPTSKFLQQMFLTHDGLYSDKLTLS